MFRQDQETSQEMPTMSPEEVDRRLKANAKLAIQSVNDRFNPAKYTIISTGENVEKPFGQQLIEEAEASGEEMLEISGTYTIKVPKPRIIDNQTGTTFRALAQEAIYQANVQHHLIQEINDSCPDIVAATKQIEINTIELNSMLTSSLNDFERSAYGNSPVTGLFDYERAKQLYAEIARLREKFNAPDPIEGRLTTKFLRAGYPLTEAREPAEIGLD